MVLACMLLFGLPGLRRRWRALLGMFVLLAALGLSRLGCGEEQNRPALRFNLAPRRELTRSP